MSPSRIRFAALLGWAAACAVAGAGNEAATPTGTVHGDIASAYRLAVVYACRPDGADCRLGWVDARKDDDVAALVGRRLGQARPGQGQPTVQVLAVCGGGWLASVSYQAQAGGATPAVPAGSAAVCGYDAAQAALSAALDACDSQTGGACRRSGRLRVSWGQWDGGELPGRDRDPGAVYDAWPGGLSCESPVPLQVSASCSEPVVRVLRQAGVP